MNFINKTFLIVGGTSGMGFAISKKLLELGANIVAIGLDDKVLAEANLPFPENFYCIQGNAVEPRIIAEGIELAIKQFGVIHGLFHIAGGSGRRWGDGPLHEMTDEGWDKTLELNIKSVMISNRAIINYFIENKVSGTILNMGSILATSPSPKFFVTHAYAAAKSALIGFSKSIAAYYAKNNIRVNVISPGLFITPMAARAAENDEIMGFIKTKQPLSGGRAGQPEDIISAALMFLDNDSCFITGQVLAVDGGWSVSEGQYSGE